MRSKTISVLTVAALMTVLVSACSAIAKHHATFTGKNDRTQPASRADDPISGEWIVSFFVHDSTTPGTFTLKLDGTKVTGKAYSDHTGEGTVPTVSGSTAS